MENGAGLQLAEIRLFTQRGAGTWVNTSGTRKGHAQLGKGLENSPKHRFTFCHLLPSSLALVQSEYSLFSGHEATEVSHA